MLGISVGDPFWCPTSRCVGEDEDAIGTVTTGPSGSCARRSSASATTTTITAASATYATITCSSRTTAATTSCSRSCSADKETRPGYSTGPDRVLAASTSSTTSNG